MSEKEGTEFLEEIGKNVQEAIERVYHFTRALMEENSPMRGGLNSEGDRLTEPLREARERLFYKRAELDLLEADTPDKRKKEEKRRKERNRGQIYDLSYTIGHDCYQRLRIITRKKTPIRVEVGGQQLFEKLHIKWRYRVPFIGQWLTRRRIEREIAEDA